MGPAQALSSAVEGHGKGGYRWCAIVQQKRGSKTGKRRRPCRGVGVALKTYLASVGQAQTEITEWNDNATRHPKHD